MAAVGSFGGAREVSALGSRKSVHLLVSVDVGGCVIVCSSS